MKSQEELNQLLNAAACVVSHASEIEKSGGSASTAVALLKSELSKYMNESDHFLPVRPIPASSAEVIARQQRQIQFWKTWAIMMSIFFGLLFLYAVNR